MTSACFYPQLIFSTGADPLQECFRPGNLKPKGKQVIGRSKLKRCSGWGRWKHKNVDHKCYRSINQRFNRWNLYLNKINVMQNSQSPQLVTKRNSRLSSIRESLKEMPLRKLSSKAQNRFQRHLQQKTKSCQIQRRESGSNQSETQASESEEAEMGVFEIFNEKYQILEKLGEGCNACVYKCQDRFSQRIYAVKKAKLQEQQIQEAKENFLNIQALKHPQISLYKAFYYDSHQRTSFTVMEYCPFPNLSAYRIQNEEELQIIVKQLVTVIQYLHQNSICHRDIKPENILYDPLTKQVKMIDFGISKKTVRMGQKREMLTIIGSNCYLAPEIYLGGGYDQRVDVWCLGVTIFKLVTGHTPFEAQYCSETIKNIIKGEVKFEHKAWQSYSAEARDFVGRLLKEKTQRMTLKECGQHGWLARSNFNQYQ